MDLTTILNNANITLIQNDSGCMTKEVHLAEINDDKYIIRRCKTNEIADIYERNFNLLISVKCNQYL